MLFLCRICPRSNHPAEDCGQEAKAGAGEPEETSRPGRIKNKTSRKATTVGAAQLQVGSGGISDGRANGLPFSRWRTENLWYVKYLILAGNGIAVVFNGASVKSALSEQVDQEKRIHRPCFLLKEPTLPIELLNKMPVLTASLLVIQFNRRLNCNF